MAEAAKETTSNPRSIAKAAMAPMEAKERAVRADDASAYASVLVSEDGSTIIHHDVVAKIAGLAVREVEGVHELVPFDTSQAVSRLAKRMVGRTMRELGVQVEVGKTQAAVDVRIVTEYGVSIVDIAHSIRKNVRSRIESLTGLEVVEVNVEVVDLYFADDASSAEEPQGARVR